MAFDGGLNNFKVEQSIGSGDFGRFPSLQNSEHIFVKSHVLSREGGIACPDGLALSHRV